MGRLSVIGFGVLAIAAGSVWHYRATVRAFFYPPPAASRPAEAPDVLYSWVDEQGVTHFSSQPGKGRRLEYDGSRITPVDVVEAPAVPAGPTPAGEGLPAGNVLMDVRAEMERNARAMAESKAAQQGI